MTISTASSPLFRGRSTSGSNSRTPTVTDAPRLTSSPYCPKLSSSSKSNLRDAGTVTSNYKGFMFLCCPMCFNVRPGVCKYVKPSRGILLDPTLMAHKSS